MRKLVILFPGIGYHCDKPLLYYARKLAIENGYTDCVCLSYFYEGTNLRGNDSEMQKAFQSLYAQAKEQLKSIDFSFYDDILFISKSVGTMIANAFANDFHISCRTILYTPLIQTFDFPCVDSIAFIGERDPWSDVENVIEASMVPIYAYENANHSLETNDVLKNLEILQDVMQKTNDFIKR